MMVRLIPIALHRPASSLPLAARSWELQPPPTGTVAASHALGLPCAIILGSTFVERTPAEMSHATPLPFWQELRTIRAISPAYLDPITGRIADLSSPKRILGQLHGNAVRFWSGSNLDELIVGEGLENTLSVGTALPEFNLASCLTATHLGRFIPPPGVKRIWIAPDNDVAGERAAQTLASKLVTSGIECACLVPKLGDFNENLLVVGKDALRHTLISAMNVEGLSD